MRLTFLGKETQGGGSPTLFATDRQSYVVQGWKVSERTDCVEIPQRLLGHLEPGTCVGGSLRDTGRGSFVLSGQPVTDHQVLKQIAMPDHETCVEVTKKPAPTEGSGTVAATAG
ncbi:hypothetical protein EV193_1044 [Herbihabitans rhizosphaerae]|uniref:Uncharacterized protein n=1 Tax=Herbihabitans rhizosphaerae TaxID=1872711 RepID=A0A4Q7KQJ1_9PSEU|nr:hypothetical protein [Herbihabitans rhizosphaerae]RZS38795.1 hypothetical protein EV193_1044 [Herbihabitans rhizosphaerae]